MVIVSLIISVANISNLRKWNLSLLKLSLIWNVCFQYDTLFCHPQSMHADIDCRRRQKRKQEMSRSGVYRHWIFNRFISKVAEKTGIKSHQKFLIKSSPYALIYYSCETVFYLINNHSFQNLSMMYGSSKTFQNISDKILMLLVLCLLVGGYAANASSQITSITILLSV